MQKNIILYSTMEQLLTNYYLSQSGNGMSDIGTLYHIHPKFYQSGSGGIGSFFSAIYRQLKPILKSGLSALKKQTIKSGTNIINEIGTKPIKEILVDQGKLAAAELTQKGVQKLRKLQDGEGTAHSFTFKKGKGIKRKVISSASQLIAPLKRRRHNLRKKKVVDIFTN